MWSWAASTCTASQSNNRTGWPSTEIAVMGPDAAVNIIHRRRLADSDDPDTTRAQLIEQYRDNFAKLYRRRLLTGCGRAVSSTT